MAYTYLGKVSNLATVSELRSLSGIISHSGTGYNDSFYPTFSSIKTDKGLLLVCDDKPIFIALYDKIIDAGVQPNGKTITIKGRPYKCRLISSLEWDEIVVVLMSSYVSLQYGTWTSTQPTPTTARVRGRNVLTGSEDWAFNNTFGFRPVLEYLPWCSNSLSSQDLGDILVWTNKAYTITGDTFTLVEKLDGTTIRTLSNQASGTSYTLDLSTQWNSLAYGKHTVEIIATDSNGLSNTVTITFNKIKAPIQKLPSNATLVQRANFTQEMNNEISYQNSKLAQYLSDKGVTATASDKLSILIDKVGTIPLGKKFASGSCSLSSSTKTFSIATTGSVSTKYITLPKLNFVPTLIIATGEYTYSGSKQKSYSVFDRNDTFFFSNGVVNVGGFVPNNSNGGFSCCYAINIYVEDNGTYYIPFHNNDYINCKWLAIE